jgi:acetaldehyde dehydrogenase/alcohol dehydrogenase
LIAEIRQLLLDSYYGRPYVERVGDVAEPEVTVAIDGL